jgi:7,8-dihydropterin-6-yl-methyl-4-(beta-D-ribofuranosyl)aminobenzene 5'-phosphate synthase
MTTPAMDAQLRAVDELRVQLLVDNVTDGLSTNPSHVHSEMRCVAEQGLSVVSGAALCCANHGLSLVIRATRGADRYTVLFDAGPEAYAVDRNGRRLGIDFGAIDAMVLSHGHWDHGGGMLKAARMIRLARPDGPLPCYLHPEMFRQRGIRFESGVVIPFEDVPTPAAYREERCEPVVTDAPVGILDESFYVSGGIPRVTAYESGLPGHVARDHGSAEWEPDPLIVDERFVAVEVRGKGLVVFTACAHAGLINTLTEARRVFPEIPIHAVVGGFHLAGKNPETRIDATVRDLVGFDPRWIVPSHCTGWRAVRAMADAFGDERVVPGAVGKRITFGSA